MKISAFIILEIIFVILKLTSVISWSWAWVLSPLWICLILVAVAILANKLYESNYRANKLSRKRTPDTDDCEKTTNEREKGL